MNGRPEQIFFQRRNADDQQSHEKMLSTTNNQGTGNQKHSKMSEQLLSKRTHIINVGEDVQKRELLHTVGENVTWHRHSGKQYGVFSKKNQ